jgi:hypothetical protein
METKINALAIRIYNTIYDADSLKSVYSEILNDIVNTFISIRLEKILNNVKIEFEIKNIEVELDLFFHCLSKSRISDLDFSETISQIFRDRSLEKIPKEKIIELFQKNNYNIDVKEIENCYRINNAIIISKANKEKYKKLVSYYLELNSNDIDFNCNTLTKDNGYRIIATNKQRRDNVRNRDLIIDVIITVETILIQRIIPPFYQVRIGSRYSRYLDQMFFRSSKYVETYYKEKSSMLEDLWDYSYFFNDDYLHPIEYKIGKIISRDNYDEAERRIILKELKKKRRDINNKQDDINEIQSTLEYKFNGFCGYINRLLTDGYWTEMEKKKLSEEVNKTKKLKIEVTNLNIDLQRDKKMLESKFTTKKKHITLPDFKNSHNYSWSNLKLIFSVDYKIIAYELIDSKKRLNISKRLRKILVRICLAPEARDIEYSKQDKYDINRFLKETFNISKDAIIWNRNQKVYKLNFQYEFLKYKLDLKMITVSSSEVGFEFTQDKQGINELQSKKNSNEYDSDLAGYEEFYPDD